MEGEKKNAVAEIVADMIRDYNECTKKVFANTKEIGRLSFTTEELCKHLDFICETYITNLMRKVNEAQNND